jgi:hypothetical protein
MNVEVKWKRVICEVSEVNVDQTVSAGYVRSAVFQ